MPFIAIPNTMQAMMRFIVDGRRRLVCVYARPKFGLVNHANLVALGSACGQWFLFQSCLIFSNKLTFIDIMCRDMTSATGELYRHDLGEGMAGALSANPLPGNVCLVTTWYGSNRRVSQIGRTSWPGIPEHVWLGDHWAGDYLTTARTTMGYMANRMTAFGLDHVIVSLRESNQPRLTPLVTNVTGYVVSLSSGSMKRRVDLEGV